MLSTLGRFRSAWQHRLDRILPAGSHRRAITFDLLVGILILAAMLGLQWAGMVSASPDWAADALMPYHTDTPAHERRARPFAFIDIDNETYREWGEPLVTPRDKLAELIDFAAEAGAAAVIVDIDLSRETKPHEDQKLREVLDAHGAEAQASPPHIILARSFDLGRTEPTSAGYLRPRPSFLDPVVAANSYLHWASSLYNQERDLAVRRWRLWEVTCRDDKPEILPSIQLLTVALLDGKKEALDDKLEAIKPAGCSLSSGEPDDPMLCLGESHVDLLRDRVQRILYTIPHRERIEVAADVEELGGQPRAGDRRDNLLLRISARHVTESRENIDPGSVARRMRSSARATGRTTIGTPPRWGSCRGRW